MNEVKKKAYEDAKKYNKTILEVNPGDWEDEWWKDAAEYWEGEAHKHRSTVATGNRKKLKMGHKPPRGFWYKKMHSKKVEGVPIDELPENAQFLTQESQEIAARYADIVERNRDALANMPGGVDAAEHPIQWWLEVVAPGMTRPPKNELPGFPRILASSILPNLAANYRAHRGDGAGSSSQGAGGSQVPDAIFFNLVRSIMEDAQANPTAYHTLPTYDQVNSIASAALEMQRNPESGATSFSNTVLGEVTRYVGTIVTSIYKKYEAEHQAVKSEIFLVLVNFGSVLTCLCLINLICVLGDTDGSGG
ncbi:hypothetical protein POM88_004620 [Heracleum sosnowskyi]|uniref:Uncharacterized protein n=1 Tax=Heracleum sosnowskyi TaxID=360622 RepID=A0AAD8N7U4_9APIA|nr:hypothetical protein POM88_004620 [Heracleum sosnowskyi]